MASNKNTIPNQITYVHRTNIKTKNGETDTKAIKKMRDKNLISIYMWNKTEQKDIEDWKALKNDKKETGKKISPYIKQFYNLYKDSQKGDIVVYAKYLTFDSKLGLIRRGSKITENKDEKDRTFYCLELTDIKNFNKSDYPLLETTIPYYGTVSKVIKGNEKLLCVFHNIDLPLKMENLSAQATELMCSEWLRSEYNKKYPIKYQLMPTGGNNSDIDFLGLSKDNKKIAVQITTTNNNDTIKKKALKLKNFKADIRIMFAQSDNFNKSDIKYISIKEVWDDFDANKEYKSLLEFLIRN